MAACPLEEPVRRFCDKSVLHDSLSQMKCIIKPVSSILIGVRHNSFSMPLEFIVFSLAKPTGIYSTAWEATSDFYDQGRMDHLGTNSLREAKNLPAGAAISGPRIPIICGT